MNCQQCGLHTTRTTIVTGEGDCVNGIMCVGEAPGEEEDLQGRPFVGTAGKTLRGLLVEAGINPANCRITNTVKCRPPENRRPTTEERSACWRHLEAEVERYRPKVIIAVGLTAAQAILRVKLPMGVILKKAGTVGLPWEIGNHHTIVVPIYHTSPLCVNRIKAAKQQIFEGLVRAKKIAEGKV